VEDAGSEDLSVGDGEGAQPKRQHVTLKSMLEEEPATYELQVTKAVHRKKRWIKGLTQ
jgi:hypothetical protein